MDVYSSPLGHTVEALQDVGRSVWFFGLSADGSRALVVDSDNAVASVADLAATGSLGRWECSAEHLRACTGLYSERFPVRA